MLRIERTNQLHIDADNLHNRIVRHERKVAKDEHRIYRGMIEENTLASYVESTLNDDTAFTGKDKEAKKYEILNWKRRAKRAVKNRYYVESKTGDEDSGYWTYGLDIQFNRTDRIYSVEVRQLKDDETLTNNGDIKKKKVEPAKPNASEEPAKPDTAEMVKELTADNEKLTANLNSSSKDISERDDTIATLQKRIDELTAENERLTKDKSVLVNAIKTTARVPKVLKAMVN